MPMPRSRVAATQRTHLAEPAPSFPPAEANDDIDVARGSQADHNIPLAISDAERKLFSAMFGSLIEQILAEPDQ
jgi:hypothetical protein